jgi:hypothetical protein
MEAQRNPDDLTILAVEAMMRKCLTRLAFVPPAAYPDHARATGRPLDERPNARRQCRSAAILALVDEKGVRQRRRRAEDRHDIFDWCPNRG